MEPSGGLVPDPLGAQPRVHLPRAEVAAGEP